MARKRRAKTGSSDKAERREARRQAPDPSNDDDYDPDDLMHDEVEQYHLKKDKIGFEDSESGEDGKDELESDNEAVFDLNVPDESDDESDGGDDDESNDENQNNKDQWTTDKKSGSQKKQPEKTSKGMKAKKTSDTSDSSEDDDSDEEDRLKGWGGSKRAHYGGDTADLEIGQDLRDAEDEAAAALELQRERLQAMDEQDFGDSEDESDGDEDDGEQAKKGGAGKTEKIFGDGLALGSLGSVQAEAVETLGVARADLSSLSAREKADLVVGAAPELPALCAAAKAAAREWRGRVRPLRAALTEEMGASREGLRYLDTQHELLLSYLTTSAFYLLLKAEGRGGAPRRHPAAGPLAALGELLGGLRRSAAGRAAGPQVDLLLRALSGSGPAAKSQAEESGQSDNESASEDEDDIDHQDLQKKQKKHESQGEKKTKLPNGSSSMDKTKRLEQLRALAEEEENAFMKKVPKKSKSTDWQQANDVGDMVEEETDNQSLKRKKMSSLVNTLQQKVQGKKTKADASGDMDVPFRDPKKLKQISGNLEEGGDEATDEMNALFGARSKESNDQEWSDDNQEDKEDQDIEEDAFYKAIAQMKKQQKEDKSKKYKVHKVSKAPEKVKSDERRGASYEMIANRGLVAHKKKINRNPRVKKRVAYERALVRRKGQVREMREGEANTYGGELTGIRANVSRSRKIKN